MITVVGHLHPLANIFLRRLPIQGRRVFPAHLVSQFGIGPQRGDGLRRQIDIVRQMARKIIRTELVFRVQPFGFQVLGPAAEDIPILTDKVDIAFRFRHGR